VQVIKEADSEVLAASGSSCYLQFDQQDLSIYMARTQGRYSKGWPGFRTSKQELLEREQIIHDIDKLDEPEKLSYIKKLEKMKLVGPQLLAAIFDNLFKLQQERSGLKSVFLFKHRGDLIRAEDLNQLKQDHLTELKSHTLMASSINIGKLSLSIWPRDGLGSVQAGRMLMNVLEGLSASKTDDLDADYVPHQCRAFSSAVEYHQVSFFKIGKSFYAQNGYQASFDLAFGIRVRIIQRCVRTDYRFCRGEKSLFIFHSQAPLRDLWNSYVDMHVLVEVVDGKEVRRIDNVKDLIDKRNNFHRLEHMYYCKQSLLLITRVRNPKTLPVQSSLESPR
jgi:hypothetical protein